MIRDARIKVAAALLIGVLSLLGSAQVHAAELDTRYACDGGQRLVVHRRPGGAYVEFSDRTYELRSKPSNLGERYVSATAALIIDGRSAVFAAEDRLQLGTCVEAIPAAPWEEAVEKARWAMPGTPVPERPFTVSQFIDAIAQVRPSHAELEQ